MYENWKLEKAVYWYNGDDPEKQAAAEQASEEYTIVANWCNENGNYTIADTGEYYEVVPVEQGVNND